MKNILLLLICSCSFINAQEIITGSYNFQGDPDKKFALYIPSNYDELIPSNVIVGLHPWNTAKWDAESWTEELMELAEANNCIVISPDGGADGQIDDDIDTAFTSFLIDEVALQYNLDENNMYLVGFSWGGKTVYTYGLNHVNRFAGFMPIGAAVTKNEVEDFGAFAQNKPFYIIHGSQDNPSVRFTPLVSLMEGAGACVETNLLAGVGHTVEFPDQFNILNTAFQWLQDNACNAQVFVDQFSSSTISLLENRILLGESLRIDTEEKISWVICNSMGQQVMAGSEKNIAINLPTATYFITINGYVSKFIVL